MRSPMIQKFGVALMALLLSACAARGIPTATGTGEQPAARALLQKSAEAHGLSAWRTLQDVSVSYTGEWASVVGVLQPTLTDVAFRQGSEERLLLGREPILAQQHQGSKGAKQVLRTVNAVTVRYNNQISQDKDQRDAAALVADGYRMFLSGPFYFLEGNQQLELAGTEEIDGRRYDTLLAVRSPGHGFSKRDEYLLFIDQETGVLRRVRFSMEGLESTQGAVAQVDFYAHRKLHGVLWASHYIETLRKPVPGLAVHDWRLTGLDVNRGFTAADVSGANFTGAAQAPAKRLTAE